MDFNIYEKIFNENDEIKKYKILKSIAYVKIKEHKDLNNFFPLLIKELLEIISLNNPQNHRNEKFLLTLMLITHALKENNKLDIFVAENKDLLYKTFDFFLFRFSIECNQNYFGKKNFLIYFFVNLF